MTGGSVLARLLGAWAGSRCCSLRRARCWIGAGRGLGAGPRRPLSRALFACRASVLSWAPASVAVPGAVHPGRSGNRRGLAGVALFAGPGLASLRGPWRRAGPFRRAWPPLGRFGPVCGPVPAGLGRRLRPWALPPPCRLAVLLGLSRCLGLCPPRGGLCPAPGALGAGRGLVLGPALASGGAPGPPPAGRVFRAVLGSPLAAPAPLGRGSGSRCPAGLVLSSGPGVARPVVAGRGSGLFRDGPVLPFVRGGCVDRAAKIDRLDFPLFRQLPTF